MKFLGLILCFCVGSSAFAQSLLFRELFRRSDKAQYDFSYSSTTSHWQNPYGRQSRVRAAAQSQAVVKDQSRFKFQATYENVQFEEDIASEDFLENPAFAALWDLDGFERRHLSEISILSPSDKPYDSWDEISINANWATTPLEPPKEYWIWFVNFSSTRSFLPSIPLPGFSYIVTAENGWNYSLGLPFLSANYFDPKTWSAQFTAGPYFYNAMVSHGPPSMKTTLFSTWRQDSFFIADRADRSERLFLDQKDVGISFRHPLNAQILIDWSIKYVFDRQQLFGKSYSDKTRPNLDTGTSVDLAAQLIFTP